MKRRILGLLVVALAMSLSAYTNRPNKEATGYYWFPLDSYSGDPQMVNTLVYSPSDPYQCTNWAPGGYCAGAFTSYSGTKPPYSAAGVEMMVHYSLFY
ncbi:MAG TPA: hypothetical protein VHC96_07765 [Puia sp.]|jgi:hypothetical protein|nr:hypothetical protein [Puia sp.]